MIEVIGVFPNTAKRIYICKDCNCVVAIDQGRIIDRALVVFSVNNHLHCSPLKSRQKHEILTVFPGQRVCINGITFESEQVQ